MAGNGYILSLFVYTLPFILTLIRQIYDSKLVNKDNFCK